MNYQTLLPEKKIRRYRQVSSAEFSQKAKSLDCLGLLVLWLQITFDPVFCFVGLCVII